MKNILITGCSRGIGFETVKSFAKEKNINVLAIARTSSGLDKLEKDCYEINSKFQLHTLSLDLSNIDSINQIVTYVELKFNKSLDGLIHNAGFLVKKPS